VNTAGSELTKEKLQRQPIQNTEDRKVNYQAGKKPHVYTSKHILQDKEGNESKKGWQNESRKLVNQRNRTNKPENSGPNYTIQKEREAGKDGEAHHTAVESNPRHKIRPRGPCARAENGGRQSWGHVARDHGGGKRQR